MPCKHEEVEWRPVEIGYGPDGLAAITQFGVCVKCRVGLEIGYEPEPVRVVEAA